MLNNEGQAASVVKILDPVSAANTAAATSGWIDVRDYEGDLAFVPQIGAVTFTSFSCANSTQKLTVPAGSVRGWIKYLGTVTTGPAITAVSMLARPKIV